jgi:Cu/Zn superoxide dismutase
MKQQWVTGILVLATATGVAFAQESKKMDGKKGAAKSLNVRMHAQNKSGEAGSAKLTAQGADKTRVEISLKGAPKGTPQPAHIHEGSCAKLDPKPKYGLENVVDGKSSTVVPAGLDSVRGMAINVHKSTDDIKTYVSCGDIGKGGAATKKGEKKGAMEKKS